MYGKKNQRKRGFRRVMVTLLSLTLLLGICMPGLYVSAEGEANLTLEVGQTKDLQGTSVVEGVPAVDHSWAIMEGADYITIAPQGDDAVVSVTANASGEATLNHTYYLTDSSDSVTEFFTVKVNSATNTDTDTDIKTNTEPGLVR